MPPQTLLLLLILPQIIVSESENILFDQGHIKFVRHGKRQTVYNVEHFDDKVVPNDKQLLIVKTKWMVTMYAQSVRNLPNLQHVVLANCGIQKIEENAFFNLPNLTVLHLQDNHLKEVKKNVFSGLSVKILSLHRNEIKLIESQAFDDMPNLFRIKLNSNRLKIWDSQWFKNTPKLTELYFRRNRLNYLPPKAFQNIRMSHLIDGRMTIDTKIFLSKNKLGQINPESFYDLEEISQLYLDRNSIHEIPEGAFRDLSTIDVVYLARNRISVIKGNAFPKVRKIGILDLSSNLLDCLPYELVALANITYLEKNNGTCDCIRELKVKLKEEKRSCEISYDRETCPDE